MFFYIVLYGLQYYICCISVDTKYLTQTIIDFTSQRVFPRVHYIILANTLLKT
jgi:hypothetical protein